MVKLGKAFSILVVFALLILLAPAVILSPVASVAANGEAVTQEVEATFNFTENVSGEWHVFTAGFAGVQAGYGTVAGLTLEQYTRPYVFLTAPAATQVPGCGFRNYTTGSGTVTGMDGPVSLMWNTFRFNMTYSGPGDLYYPSATDFGWMAGRGHIGENLTFVFVADLDCDDTMTNAEGKGFMVSTEESGASAGHKVIGDFEVVKTDKNYTWSLHLRDYAPNEVYYRGNVTVYGGVMQELTDPMPPNGVDIVNFTKDGPESTPTDFPTKFEEICWGKDPTKTVTGGPLGANGTMDITRNGALYLTLPGGWCHIQGAMACKLHIDDTYATTGDDGSSYGHAYYYLLLALPYQELIFGDFFNQTGYTWGPFGMPMPLQSTDWYSGMETFANAHIGIESSATDSLQTSVDESFGLYPHPKVENVTPSSGAPGETNKMVTISGKYFLRAAGPKSGLAVPNSGSVDFGPNITVNGYTINNATNPIDNSITVNITIDAGAPAGVRVVNVTSCFHYSNGTGGAPYKSGLGNFTVAAGGTTLQGQVDLSTALGAAPKATWIQSFEVKGFAPGTLNANWTKNVTTNTFGAFTVSVDAGTYDIGIKNCTCLSELETGVVLPAGNLTQVNFDLIRQGDCDDNDMATAGDRGLLYDGWNSANIYQSGHLCDLNRDGGITAADRGLLYDQWNTGGAAYGGF